MAGYIANVGGWDGLWLVVVRWGLGVGGWGTVGYVLREKERENQH